MKKKRILLALCLLAVSNLYAAEIEGRADEIEVNFNTDTLDAKEGIVLRQGNMKTKVHQLQRDKEKGMAYYRDGLIAELDNPTGRVKIESKEGDHKSSTKVSQFYKNFGYLEVASVTGAEQPNDRIYFGSEYMKNRGYQLWIHDAWLTTDFKAVNHPYDPNSLAYHILADRVLIEADKQLTIYDSNLYLGSHKVLPVEFPWFRLNIRKDSNIPLFPTWTEEMYYGWNIEWGYLYGNRDSKLKGGISPKFADRMGWMLGHWETWYDTKKYGETKINVTDLLLHPKEEAKDDAVVYEQKHKRYKVETKHDYSGEYGDLHVNVTNETLSMNDSLNDVVTKYESNSEFTNKKGIQGTGVHLRRPHFDHNLGFYKVNSDLKNMGPEKDVTLKTDLNLTNDKELYTLSVYDDVEDNAFGAKSDNALYTDIALYKDNADYKIGGYYHYLDDITPGYTMNYDRSHGEDYGFIALDKKHELGVQYDEATGDRMRKLNLWEKDSNASGLKRENPLGLPIDYSPLKVREYETDDSKHGKIYAGKYEAGDFVLRPTVEANSEEKVLDTSINGAITSKLNPDYSRMRQYNRFNNVLYTKNKEQRVNMAWEKGEDLKGSIYTGSQEENFRARDGEVQSTDLKEHPLYTSKSDFVGTEVEKKDIYLGKSGDLDLRGKVRYDNYRNSDASSYLVGAGLTHKIELREDLSNTLDVDVEHYYYAGGKEEDKAANLYHKNNSYRAKDNIVWDAKAVRTDYSGSYQVDTNPYHSKDKKLQKWDQSLGFDFKEDRKVKVFYGEDERYTNRIITKENPYIDLESKNYGFETQYKNHGFTYKKDDIHFTPVKTALEEVSEDQYGYTYKWDDQSLALSYRDGKDRTMLEDRTTDPVLLDVENKLYSLHYHKAGEVEHDVFLSYEDSRHKEAANRDKEVKGYAGKRNLGNTDELHFAYQYKDTRMTDAEYIKYADLEKRAGREPLSYYDMQKMQNLLREREQKADPFRLQGIKEDAFLFGDYRVNFRFFGSLERNKARYDLTHNLGDSIEKIKGGLFYRYHRYGVGYIVEQNAGWIQAKGSSAYEWKNKNREHQISLYGKVGPVANSWKVKTYAKFYENLLEKIDEKDKKKTSLDGLGVEIGKEKDFYEWSMVYERVYSMSAHDYEWRVGLQFTLLTFPENSLFGIGRESKGNRNRVKTEFLESIKMEDIVDEELKTESMKKN